MTLRPFSKFATVAALAFLAACAQKPGAPVTAPVAPEKPQPKKPLEFEARDAAKVALLVPLTGDAAETGKALRDAALMAALDAGDRTVKLVIYDTGDTNEEATAAADQALKDGAGLILGPLYSAQVTAVATAARTKSVPVLGFSNDVTVAGNGAYVLGFGPAEEVRRVVAFAKSNGFNKMAALYPSTRYGERVKSVTAEAAGGLVMSVNYSQPVKATIPSVKKLSARGVKFNALMIAEGDPYIRSLTPLLPAYGIVPEAVKFLGTGLLDVDSLGNEAVLKGAWYAAPPPDAVRAFFNRYYADYGVAAPRIASLAYDGFALAHALIVENGPKKRISYAQIEDPRGYKGVDGLFRLNANGRAERALAVLELQPRKPKVVDLAEERFTETPPRDLGLEKSAK